MIEAQVDEGPGHHKAGQSPAAELVVDDHRVEFKRLFVHVIDRLVEVNAGGRAQGFAPL